MRSNWTYDAWIESSDEIVEILMKLEIKWIVHKFERILENTILLIIVLLFWIKWIMDSAKYHFHLKILIGNFLLE